VGRTAGQLDPATTDACEALLAGLPERFAALAACGLPDSLVHGDFHAGNVRGSGVNGTIDRLVLLDWGDCGVGHPLLDQAAFLGPLSPADAASAAAEWEVLWRRLRPGSDYVPAVDLVRPVAALRQAAIYRTFLDAIEPDERVYYAGDPARWLRAAALAFHS
jgi:aminoglycoside phosphotransferase (APT) family kinase protein